MLSYIYRYKPSSRRQTGLECPRSHSTCSPASSPTNHRASHRNDSYRCSFEDKTPAQRSYITSRLKQNLTSSPDTWIYVPTRLFSGISLLLTACLRRSSCSWKATDTTLHCVTTRGIIVVDIAVLFRRRFSQPMLMRILSC